MHEKAAYWLLSKYSTVYPALFHLYNICRLGEKQSAIITQRIIPEKLWRLVCVQLRCGTRLCTLGWLTYQFPAETALLAPSFEMLDLRWKPSIAVWKVAHFQHGSGCRRYGGAICLKNPKAVAVVGHEYFIISLLRGDRKRGNGELTGHKQLDPKVSHFDCHNSSFRNNGWKRYQVLFQVGIVLNGSFLRFLELFCNF